MHNAYLSLTLCSLRTKGSLPFPFNDSCFLNERFGTSPVHFSLSSSYCCCNSCASYAFPTHRVSINPSFLYGLRQSTLLQCAPSRRFLLVGPDRYFCRFPLYGLDSGCHEVPCLIKERRVCCNGRGRRRERKCCCCRISGDMREICGSGRFEDEDDYFEEVLSLLSDEVGEECFCGRERCGSSVKKVGVEKRRSFVDRERNVSLPKRAELERRRNNSGREKNYTSYEKVKMDKKRVNGSECNIGERKNGKSGILVSKKSIDKIESVVIESNEEENRQNERRALHLRSGNRGGSKKSSSCSSYYSLSSSGDIESDPEIQEKHRRFVGESSSGYVQRTSENDKKGDWGKKSEKKLSEVLNKETQSQPASSQRQSRVLLGLENDYEEASSSHKKESSGLKVNLDEETRKTYDRARNQDVVLSDSRGKYQNIEETTLFQKRNFGRGKDLEIESNSVYEASDEQNKIAGWVAQEEKLNLGSQTQQHTKILEIKEIETKRTSNQQEHYDTEMIKKESKDPVLNSAKAREEQLHLTKKHLIGQIDSTQNSQDLTEISVILDSNIKKTSIAGYETRKKGHKKDANLVSSSYQEENNTQSTTDKRASQRIESRKDSQDVANISLVHASDKELVTNSQRTFEKRSVNEGTNVILMEKPIKEARRKYSQIIQEDLQIESRKQSHRHAEESSYKASSSLVSQARVQGIDIDKEERIPQAMLMPPPSQLVSRNPLPASEISSQEVSPGISESYWEPLYAVNPEDTLGSADCFEKSSTQIVDEFVEKVRNEALTSEIHKEDKVLVYESEKYRQGQRSSSHDDSGGFQMVKHKAISEIQKDGKIFVSEGENYREKSTRNDESSSSLRGSGLKGPSDEMWHETYPSVVQTPLIDSPVQQTLKVEESDENAKIETAVVKRSERSLWNIISDIVRLKWGSHAEPSSSAVRPGGKLSSNESVRSETWFSDETDENKKVEKRSRQPEIKSSDSPEVSAQSQEVFDKMRSKSKMKYDEADKSSSPSIIMESGSSSGVNLLTSEEKIPGSTEIGKGIQGVSSGMEIEKSSPLLLGRGIRRSPIVVEISEAGKAEASPSMEKSENYHTTSLPELARPEENDGNLKHGFLRTGQFMRDRFEEWEEAYKRENQQRRTDEVFMREALVEAKKAADFWEVPVGAVLVKNGKIIARGCNLVEELRDSTAHAEMICIREASNQLKTWRLAETTLYVTLEPCPMCAGAILQARIDTVVWGAPNKLLGADGSWVRLFPGDREGNGSPLDKPAPPIHPFHPKIVIRRNVMAAECADAMQSFFQLRRKKQKKVKEDSPNPPPHLSIRHHPSKLLTKMHDIFHIIFCL